MQRNADGTLIVLPRIRFDIFELKMKMKVSAVTDFCGEY